MDHDSVKVDDQKVTLPHIVKNIVIQKVSTYILVYGQLDLDIKWDGNSGVYIRVGPEYRNKTCGLCGNYNGIPDDDFRSSVAVFGNSFKRPQVNQFCRNVRDEETRFPCSQLSEQQMNKVREICEVLNDYPFTLCHPFLNPKHFIKMCEEDVCSCNYTSDANCVCDSLTQYERACAREGIAIMWREPDFCCKYSHEKLN